MAARDHTEQMLYGKDIKVHASRDCDVYTVGTFGGDAARQSFEPRDSGEGVEFLAGSNQDPFGVKVESMSPR